MNLLGLLAILLITSVQCMPQARISERRNPSPTVPPSPAPPPRAAAPASSPPSLLCKMSDKPASGTLLSRPVNWTGYSQVDYTKDNWSQKVANSFGRLSNLMESRDVAFAAIDIRNVNGEPHFHYLSNGAHNRIVQPWSSTKWLAGLAALKAVKDLGVGANATVSGPLFNREDVHFGDIFTKVHAYRRPDWLQPTSNEISTWFKTVAGRAETHDLIVNRWLRRGGHGEEFGGGYNSGAYPVGKYLFRDLLIGTEAEITARDDAPSTNRENLLSMLTLAEAFKRIITHNAQNQSTRFPSLTSEDFNVLLWGRCDNYSASECVSQANGGMAVGDTRSTVGSIIDKILSSAVSRDRIIFGKTGSGCNSVRGCEQLLLSYVCLPNHDGGRQIVTAVFAQKPTADAARTILHSALRSFFHNYLQ